MESLPNFNIAQIIAIVISLVVAIVGHEIMHGFVAYKYGDETAKNQGRLSLNPIKHVDPIGTIVVPGLLAMTTNFIFGWAKPVPVYTPTVIANGGYLGAIAVSLAGIAYNISLAVIAAILLHSLPLAADSFLATLLFYILTVNVVLAIFNLYPLPPLDGFHALCYLLALLGFVKLSHKLFSLSKYGLILLILIIATPAFEYFFKPIQYVISYLLYL